MTVQESIPEEVRCRTAGLRIKEENKQASHTEGLMSAKTHWRGPGVGMPGTSVRVEPASGTGKKYRDI